CAGQRPRTVTVRDPTRSTRQSVICCLDNNSVTFRRHRAHRSLRFVSSGGRKGWWMFLRRALRYRWSQALVLAGVSLWIGACAVFGPWFARAVEQTVRTETLSGQRLAAAWQLESTTPRPRFGSAGVDQASQPEALDKLIPADVKPLFSPPLHGIHNDI